VKGTCVSYGHGETGPLLRRDGNASQKQKRLSRANPETEAMVWAFCKRTPTERTSVGVISPEGGYKANPFAEVKRKREGTVLSTSPPHNR
jgi:hypothetical protein